MELKEDDACTIQTSSSSSCLRVFLKCPLQRVHFNMSGGFFKSEQKNTLKGCFLSAQNQALFYLYIDNNFMI